MMPFKPTKEVAAGLNPIQQYCFVVPNNCAFCGKVATLRCYRCGDFYCSLACQQNDWQNHRYICFPIPKLVRHNFVEAAPSLVPEGNRVFSPNNIVQIQNSNNQQLLQGNNNNHQHQYQGHFPQIAQNTNNNNFRNNDSEHKQDQVYGPHNKFRKDRRTPISSKFEGTQMNNQNRTLNVQNMNNSIEVTKGCNVLAPKSDAYKSIDLTNKSNSTHSTLEPKSKDQKENREHQQPKSEKKNSVIGSRQNLKQLIGSIRSETNKEEHKPVKEPPFKIKSITEFGNEVKVLIVDSSVISDRCFGCIPVKYSANLLKLEEALKDYDTQEKEPYEPVLNEYCIAKYEGAWYRAKVIELVDDMRFKVMYIDYTNEATVSKEDIRRYPADLTIECCTYMCILKSIENIPTEEWAAIENKTIQPIQLNEVNQIADGIITALFGKVLHID